MTEKKPFDEERDAEKAKLYQSCDPHFEAWAKGYGMIQHQPKTQVDIYEKINYLHAEKILPDPKMAYELLQAADQLASAGMWLTVHATYAQHVYLDGRSLAVNEFKPQPEGHTGGSLNMGPAYVGYLLANALSGITRSWLMGQGHCVVAIDAINVLIGNMTPAHAKRYSLSEEGLTCFVKDFYSYAMTPSGEPASPLGSHVNAHTAGGILEGGYLGFTELEYVHMPLVGDRLVTFLSDGAFEEQRGSDWTPRWWRAEDSGLVCPILIANGRRIDQRSTIEQEGGTNWLLNHLQLNGFDPITIDGKDPAAFAWAILEMEERLTASGQAISQGKATYPVPIPYTIANTEKGYGFFGSGTNAAHNLPLGSNPFLDEQARAHFIEGIQKLWVPPQMLYQAVETLKNHPSSGRPLEKDHPCANRKVPLPTKPMPAWRNNQTGDVSAMAAIDGYICDVVKQNPHLRFRLGNPDELRSNGMNATLDLLKHRVTTPEPGIAEAVSGQVITALNEEAVVCAALGNKGGMNLVVTYEAFAPKMLGALRQEIIFSRHQKNIGKSPNWLSVPLILTSHTWENGKNEQSHQDPTCCEALLGEMSDTSRVFFPADWNTALSTINAAYQHRGDIWTLVVSKRPKPDIFTKEQAEKLITSGGIRLRGQGTEKIILTAVGAYQLEQALLASNRLQEKEIAHSVVYLLEPGRFRQPRDEQEAQFTATKKEREDLFPEFAKTRIFFFHTRPHVMMGILRPLDTGSNQTYALGYLNRGGTLDTKGMLFTNASTWAHGISKVAEAQGIPLDHVLTHQEQMAVVGTGNPFILFP